MRRDGGIDQLIAPVGTESGSSTRTHARRTAGGSIGHQRPSVGPRPGPREKFLVGLELSFLGMLADDAGRCTEAGDKGRCQRRRLAMPIGRGSETSIRLSARCVPSEWEPNLLFF